MRIGFTGTRRGMTDDQKYMVKKLLLKLKPTQFHHGDCIGADAEAHEIVMEIDENRRYTYIVKHPPQDGKQWADCQPFWASRPFKPYLQRNRDIVDETSVLIATPATARELQRSGTWATIRYARKCGKEVWIIRPDGELIQ